MIPLECNLIPRSISSYIKRKYSKNISSNKWKSVVGLEVHAQINSISKLFSGASHEFASRINNNVSLFDCATPGTLPVLNKKCVEAGVLTAMALNCKVNPVSMFDRKHYFYADIPAGYQITQQRSPLARDGYLEFQVYSPGIHTKSYTARANIKQIQLEQDSGKSLHDEDHSLVDLNRAGAPLMELVFEPDLCDGEEASALIKELTIILQRIGSCTCKMEEGAMRIDANVSIHREGEPFGVRTEVKNIGSVRGIAGAIKYEIERQVKLLEEGGRVINETRAWDAETKKTLPMRDKEQQQDYRYMPEPNLPPLHVALGPVNRGCVSVNELKKLLPELPAQTRSKLKENFNLTPEQAIILVNEPVLQNLFEESLCNKNVTDYKLVANLLINDFLTFVHKGNINIEDVSIGGHVIGEIVELIQTGVINRNSSKLLLNEIILGSTESPMKIIQTNDWMQINDPKKIEAICNEVICENMSAAKSYKNGKTKVFKALLGFVAAKSNQRVNMVKVVAIMKKLLDD